MLADSNAFQALLLDSDSDEPQNPEAIRAMLCKPIRYISMDLRVHCSLWQVTVEHRDARNPHIYIWGLFCVEQK